MARTLVPFAVDRPISDRLDRVLTYWQDLRRGAAEMPFSDDVSTPEVRKLCHGFFLIDVFARPERFRLAVIEALLTSADEDRLLGRFIDEVELPTPFEMLRAQCSATVESARPTVHTEYLADGVRYERLLLPLWGEGQVRMLLGAVDRA